MSDSVVLAEAVDQILVITINRPEARNSVNLQVAQGLAAALDRLAADPALRAGVLTGAGGYFSAGMDLKAAASGERVFVEGKGGLGFVEAKIDKPLVAAVEGFAYGGGFELALACDLIVAGKSAKFAFPEVKRGLIPGAGGVVRLPECVPRRLALEYMLTGEPVPAETFATFGLVNRLVEDGAALSAALDLAGKILVNAPLALAAVKRIVREAPDVTEAAAFRLMNDELGRLTSSQDFAEGAAAFAAKRLPVWTGR